MATAAVTDPERQFLGCVMQLPAPAAARLLTGMRPDDFADPAAAHVLTLATAVVVDGHAPTPLALLDRAMETTDTAPRAGGAHRVQHLGAWLTEVYRDAPILPAAPYGAWLKTVLLKAAWRRAVREHAARLIQASEEATTASVRACLADTARMDDLWDRYRAADTAPGAGRLEVAA
jgi:hypothetical protein